MENKLMAFLVLLLLNVYTAHFNFRLNFNFNPLTLMVFL